MINNNYTVFLKKIRQIINQNMTEFFSLFTEFSVELLISFIWKFLFVFKISAKILTFIIC